MAVLQKREAEIPLNGGMDTKQGAELQSVTTLRNVTDLRLNALGEFEKRPATASELEITTPGDVGLYDVVTGAALVESRGEAFAITTDYGVMNERGRYSGGGGFDIGLGAYPQPYLLTPKACRVDRMYVDRASASNSDQGFQTYASAAYTGTDGVVTLVTAAVVRIGSGSGCILRLQAMSLETGAVVSQLQYDSDVVTATSWAVDACENTSVADPGVVVTFASGLAAPFVVRKYRYLAATQEFVRDTDVSAALTNVRHRIKTGTIVGQFIIAGESNGTGDFFAATYGTEAATNLNSLHTGIHAADGGCDIVISGSKVLLISSTTGLAGSVYAERFGTPATYITLDTVGAAELIVSVTAARETVAGNADRAAVFISKFESTGVAPDYYRIDGRMVDFSATTCVAVASLVVLDTHIMAIAWAVTHEGRAYVLTAPSRALEAPSAMWLRFTQPITGLPGVARAVARVAHDILAENNYGNGTNLMSAFVLGDKVYSTLTSDMSEDVMPNGSDTLPQSAVLSTLDLTPRPLGYAQKDGVSTVANGVVFELDGDVATIAQPFCRPAVYAITSAVGTTSAATGIGIVAVYRWIDAAGREHRSAPSAPFNTGVFTNKRLDVTVSVLPYAPFIDTIGRTYSIDVYLTSDGGSVYRLANTAAGAKFTAFSSVGGARYFSDMLPSVAGQPELYSLGADGGELVSEATPAFLAIATIGDRMFAIDAEDRTRIWFTKPFVGGFAPEWNTVNTLTIGDLGVGISDVGGAATVFASRGIWQIYGEGPNATGAGSFAPARKLPHEVECLDGLSVCKTPQGVFFRGRRGVYMLDNAGGLQPVGLAIDSSLSVSGTPSGYCKIVYDELSNEVHVLDFDGSHYAFNALEGKWAQWSQSADFQNWADACVIRGRVYVLHAGGSSHSIMRIRAIDEFEHNHHVNGWSLQTPWIRFDGATGEHRIWELVVQLRVTGQNGADTGGPIAVVYETRDAPDSGDVFEWTAAQVFDESGGDERTINFLCPIRQQRARQFRFRVTEETASYACAGAVPIAVRVLYGVTPSAGRKTSTGQLKGSGQVG
jgi:hypothetical protein